MDIAAPIAAELGAEVALGTNVDGPRRRAPRHHRGGRARRADAAG